MRQAEYSISFPSLSKVLDAIKQFFALIRVKHWVKNFFIFLPLIFSGDLASLGHYQIYALFVSFCLAASSIYIINDIMDVDHDKAHPQKKQRPIASGFFSVTTAFVMFLGMLLLLTTSFFFIGEAFYFVLGYFIMNILYSFKLKQIAIIDVTCISAGFVLRIMAGSVAAGVYLSHWMIIMVFLLTISIAFAKRRDDFMVALSEEANRKSMVGYTIQFLDIAKGISFSVTLVAYIFFTISIEVMERFNSDKLYITSLFVFLGIMRYLQNAIVDKNSGSPVKLLFKDRFLQIILLAWFLTFIFIIYG